MSSSLMPRKPIDILWGCHLPPKTHGWCFFRGPHGELSCLHEKGCSLLPEMPHLPVDEPKSPTLGVTTKPTAPFRAGVPPPALSGRV